MNNIFACGWCGAPIDKNGDQLTVIPDNWNPDDHELDTCNSCANREGEKERMFITYEMARDAGMPELEGEKI